MWGSSGVGMSYDTMVFIGILGVLTLLGMNRIYYLICGGIIVLAVLKHPHFMYDLPAIFLIGAIASIAGSLFMMWLLGRTSKE
jgi:multisubunit Na+/H+ antiporter MnhF subunit